jgi:6-phosphofructokinase 1
VVFVPAAVENDVSGTDVCLGVDTALNGILQAAEARDRPSILEVPGKFTGYLALMGAAVARAAGALVVERPFPWDRLEARLKAGARPLLLCAEGAGTAREAGTRLGALVPGDAPRVDVLGPALRTRPPSAFDRLAAARLGEAAAAALLGGRPGRMIAWRAGVCLPVPMEEAAGRRRQVAPEVFETAKKFGVVFE